MDSRPLSFIAGACGGQLVKGEGGAFVNRVCTDSRQARTGDLFIAISGGRFDGHSFLGEVAARGVSAVLVQSGRAALSDLPCGVVEVEDTRVALGRIAAAYRQELKLLMVAVAGSNGKTTTKELVAAVLKTRFTTLWSEASFNNDLGVPFTLLRIDATHTAAVLELGTNHPGELAPLVQMVDPRIGVMTSIGREHLEHFGDLAGVVAEESSLAAGLPEGGVLVLPGDSDLLEEVADRARCRVVRVGSGPNNDWVADEVSVSQEGTSFRVTRAPAGFEGSYRVGLLGRHQVNNAMLAAAVGHELGLTASEIRIGLETCAPAKSRGVLSSYRGIQVLDDSYNANADSMRAALLTLADLPCTGRRIAVMGDMAELGGGTAKAHQEVGRIAGELGVGLVLGVGEYAAVTVDAAKEAGVAETSSWLSIEPAIDFLKSRVRPGDLILIKASRSSGLERVAEALKVL